MTSKAHVKLSARQLAHVTSRQVPKPRLRKELMSVRLDPSVVKWLKSKGEGQISPG